MPHVASPGSLLCVCNYPSNEGYAWDFIESLYAGVAERLRASGVRTYVAYPRIDRPPATLGTSGAIPVELDARLSDWASTKATVAFARQHGVRVVYLTDRPSRSPYYGALRLLARVGIVVHDHSSGARSRPAGLRRAAKWTLARVPLMQADTVVAVSDYVRRRQVEVGLVPADRVVRVWNGMEVPPPVPVTERVLHDALGIGHDRLIVACACRTAPEKGVPVLMKAFDLVWQRWPADRVKPLLVYMGDGPQFPEVQQLRPQLNSAADIILTGYRLDAVRLVGGADVCAMPSVWEDALPLAVMQPMAQGRPVVASSVGGIPEMIVDGHSGVLVPPNDVPALADALERLLTDRAWATALGAEARARIASMFTRTQQIDALSGILGRLVGVNG